MMQKHNVSSILFAIFIGCFTAYSAIAQEECVDLAKVIGREITKTGDSEQIAISNKAHLCSSKYEGASREEKADIEASYGLFTGGASGSSSQIKELQTSQCEDHYNPYWYNKITNVEINRVSVISADILKSCINSRTFRVSSVTINNEAAIIAFLYSGVASVQVNGIVIQPSAIASCDVLVGGASVPSGNYRNRPLNSGDTLTLSCRRTGQASGHNRLHYQGGVVGVATSADSPMLPLIDYSDPPISEPTAASLSTAIAEIKAKLTSMVQPRSVQQLCSPSTDSKFQIKCFADCNIGEQVLGGSCFAGDTGGSPIALDSAGSVDDGPKRAWYCRYVDTRSILGGAAINPSLRVTSKAFCAEP